MQESGVRGLRDFLRSSREKRLSDLQKSERSSGFYRSLSTVITRSARVRGPGNLRPS